MTQDDTGGDIVAELRLVELLCVGFNLKYQVIYQFNAIRPPSFTLLGSLRFAELSEGAISNREIVRCGDVHLQALHVLGTVRDCALFA